jgi:hypothetical protein
MVTAHSQGLTGLSAATTYHFRVLSKDAAGNIATSGDNVFTTSTPPDTTAPVISGIVSSNITLNSAVITWTTNEASSTQVQYGTTTAYGSTSALNSALLTGHTITLTGLSASAIYHYRVISKDAAGNTATSTDNTFTASASSDTTPPTISGVVSSNITSDSALIKWNTDEASTSQVEYGTTSTYGSFSPADAALVNSHTVTLLGLAPGTTYQYRVNSRDAIGNSAVSTNNTFTTGAQAPPDTTPPGDIQSFKGSGKNRKITLSWTNPSDADFVGVRIHFRGDRYPVDQNDGELLGDFSGKPNEEMTVDHGDLRNGATYYYSAASYDDRGNYQHTVYASATPENPDSGSTPTAGGCGMISPKDGTSSGPGQAADMTLLSGFILVVLIRRGIRRIFSPAPLTQESEFAYPYQCRNSFDKQRGSAILANSHFLGDSLRGRNTDSP